MQKTPLLKTTTTRRWLFFYLRPLITAFFQTKTDHLGRDFYRVVDLVENNWHQIVEELRRWRGILSSEWKLYKERRGVLFPSDTTKHITAPYIT